ncbi:MAG: LysM peptidoglycan-binding domain-containing protein [Deltaproteobacteria bacterium]|nr:LysM peptidoglycan-binding domain-containing protein [Deltaproteobacteria bacterium]
MDRNDDDILNNSDELDHADELGHTDELTDEDFILTDSSALWHREKKTFWEKVFRSEETPFILMGIGLIAIVILFFFLLSNGGADSTDRALEPVYDKLRYLEERVANLEAVEAKINQLEKQSALHKNHLSRLQRMDATTSLRLNRFSQDVAALKNGSRIKKVSRKPEKIRTQASTPKPPVRDKASVREKPLVQDKPSAQDKTSVQNKAPAVYHRVKSGETVYRISRNYGVSIETLVRLNKLSKKSSIYSGQKLLIKEAE